MERVVASGQWLYGGSATVSVFIVELDYDFWYALGEAEGDLSDDERAQLNADGRLFYVRHKPHWSSGQPFWPDSQGFPTIDDARLEAQRKVPTPISWA